MGFGLKWKKMALCHLLLRVPGFFVRPTGCFETLDQDYCRVALEVDQPRRSTYLLEADRATRSTYLWAYISCVQANSVGQSCLVLRRRINSLFLLYTTTTRTWDLWYPASTFTMTTGVLRNTWLRQGSWSLRICIILQMKVCPLKQR